MSQKLGCYGALLCGIVAYLSLQKQIEHSQTKFDLLNQEKTKLTRKIDQLRQSQRDRAQVSKDFKQAQDVGLVSFDTQESLTQYLEQLSDNTHLRNLDYQIESIKVKHMDKTTTHWYKIVFEFEHDQDWSIFQFIETLNTKLPGLILATQLSLVRAASTAPQKTIHQSVSGYYHIYLITFNFTPSDVLTP